MKNPLKRIGFWQNFAEEIRLWHPRGFVDKQWQPPDKDAIINYLRSGFVCDAELGYSFCRFRNGPPDNEMGDGYLTDGTWLWPEGLWVYVDRYDVRLPDEFVDTARRNAYQIPESLILEELEKRGWDDGFWRKWCKAHYRWRNPIQAITDWLWLFKNRGC